MAKTWSTFQEKIGHNGYNPCSKNLHFCPTFYKEVAELEVDQNLYHSTVYGPNRLVSTAVNTEKELADIQKIFAKGDVKKVPKFLSILANHQFSNSTVPSQIEDFVQKLLPGKSSFES